MQRGDVLAFGGRLSVAWSVDALTAVCLPVIARKAAPQHRGDVAAGLDWPLIPVAINAPIVRAGDPITVTRAPQRIVGHVSPALMSRIKAAVAREAAARAIEGRFALSGRMRAQRAGI